eukprot:5186667-Amphidinium_carterae.1
MRGRYFVRVMGCVFCSTKWPYDNITTSYCSIAKQSVEHHAAEQHAHPNAWQCTQKMLAILIVGSCQIAAAKYLRWP